MTLSSLILTIACLAPWETNTVMAFATHKNTKRPSGGRAPTTEDKVDAYSDLWEPTPVQNSEARLIILQITDVYTLENFASFKTLLQETRRNVEEATVVCMLTGDFLSPYLLSSVDQGKGMMNALNRIPMDYLTWGNHEADIPHKTVCRHVRNFKGKWLNSNMLDHEAMESQQEYEVIEIQSPDGSNTRKVGLIAVLSDDPGLYSHFQAPGAFGGATITDPWEALRKYKAILENEHNCDLIVPLQHLYVPDDHKTCRDFDFPIILSGHDHHRVDEVVDGTRLIKPGMNAASTAVIEISWPDNNAGKPKIHSRFVKTEDWAPDAEDEELNERAYDALEPLKNTELARVPSSFEPLTSLDSRGSVCTMGKYICSLIRSAMNVSRRHKSQQIDAVLLMGGNIRGNREYPLGSFFSLEALEAEVKGDEVIGVVPMPGWLLAEGIAATHAGEPIPGWMQYDQGIREDMSQSPPVITHVAGEPIDPERIYRVATKVSDLTNGQSLPWTDYYGAYPEVLPPKGAYINVQSELMSYFARNLWRKIWEALSKELGDTCGIDDCGSEERLKKLDSTGDGTVTVEEIQAALRDYLGLSVDDRELTLAEFVHSFADTNGDGTVTKRDMDVFCEELDNLYDTGGWRLYPKNTAISQIK